MTVEQQVLKFNEVNISQRFPIIIMFRLDQFDFCNANNIHYRVTIKTPVRLQCCFLDFTDKLQWSLKTYLNHCK